MKRPLLICFLLVWLLPAAWAINTDDSFIISNVTVAPGGNYAYFDVSLSGSRAYSAYNLDIQFPEGLSVYINAGKPAVSMLKNSMYPSSEDIVTGDITYSHVFSCSYGEAGERVLRVACYSNASESFTANGGKLFRVLIVASPYMKPGEADLQFSGQNLTTADGTKYVPADQSQQVTVSATSQVTLSVSAGNQWGTCVLPFDAAIPSGLKAYSCNEVQSDNLVLTPVTSFEAYTPYILYAASGYEGTLTGTVDASQYVETAIAGYLHGAIKAQQVTEGYVLQNQGSGVKFYVINGTTFAIPEGRCWAVVPSAANALGFVVGEETGIQQTAAKPQPHTIYSIDGKRVEQPQASRLYIINNKKVINK